MLGKTILLVSNERNLADAVRTRLIRDDYDVICVYKGQEGIRKFIELMPQAVILPDTLPDMSGWDMAQRIREMSDVPILFILTGRDRFSVERALDIGGDYVAPPYNHDSFAIKLSVLLKRRARVRSAPFYDDDYLRVDIAGRQVTRGGEPVHLSDTEFKLLSYFIRNPNRVLDHDELLGGVWGHTYLGTKSHVSLYVRYLRRKIEMDPTKPDYFRTEWGVGYSFRSRAK